MVKVDLEPVTWRGDRVLVLRRDRDGMDVALPLA